MLKANDYSVIAERIRTSAEVAGASRSPVSQAWRGAIKATAENLAILFESQNPRFDSERFIRDCKPRGVRD